MSVQCSVLYFMTNVYSKTCLIRPLSNIQKWFQDQLSLNVGQKYCRMFQGEHSAILSTFIKLSFVIKIFVLSILSGRLRQVLLYYSHMRRSHYAVTQLRNENCTHSKEITLCGNSSFPYIP